MQTRLTENITVKVGDITKEQSCAIVNAANSSLLGGGGVDGAIHRAGGESLLAACREIRKTQYPEGLPTGEAVTTTAGNMPAKYVVHTVGPIYTNCGSLCEEQLRNCYLNSMKEAARLRCDSIVFPAISTGIYGYPKREAAVIAYSSVKKLLDEYDMQVTFIFHSVENYEAFVSAI